MPGRAPGPAVGPPPRFGGRGGVPPPAGGLAPPEAVAFDEVVRPPGLSGSFTDGAEGAGVLAEVPAEVPPAIEGGAE
ncbi:hypothetical protein [Lentzea sp. NPDC004782]|uniref:hypothetical protein n=1 Tax=Lentzea sp. NPDC004782 TaxID=3154458 RepID=UPI0033B1FEC5